MKKILFITLVTFLISCSNDDSNSIIPTSNNEIVNFGIPLTQGKYWTYDVNNEGSMSRDSLYIDAIETINGKQQSLFKTLNNSATGFYSNSLRNNHVREEGNYLYLTGQLNTSQNGLPVDLNINITDFIILKKNGTNNELLDTETGTFQQTFNNIPLDITYNLKSYFVDNINSFTTLSNDTYSNLKKVKIVLNLKVTSTQVFGGFPITITYLPAQDVIISNQYIAKDLGVVFSETTSTYTIDSNIANSLGVPATMTRNQSETLDTHN